MLFLFLPEKIVKAKSAKAIEILTKDLSANQH